jgi:hypothetical protein
MTAEEYLKENSDWFDKSIGGKKSYFELEVIKLMENYALQKEISDEEISDEEIEKAAFDYVENSEEDKWTATLTFIAGVKWYREQLKNIDKKL